MHTLAAILDQEPEPIAGAAPATPVPLHWIVERCLAKDPERPLCVDSGPRPRCRGDPGPPRGRRVAAGGLDLRAPGRRRALAIGTGVSLASVLLGALLARSLGGPGAAARPSFHQITFRPQEIQSARFAPDGQTIVYGAVEPGRPFALFSTRVGSLESRPLGLAADVLSISPLSEMAILLGGPSRPGTLARAPLAGGAPREILADVAASRLEPRTAGLLAVIHVVAGKTRLESPIGNVLYESTAPLGPPRFSRRGDRILFQDGGSLAMVDPTRKVTAVGETLSPSGYGWSPGGDEVWMTVIVGSTTEVRALRPGGRERVVATFPGAFLLEDVAAAGARSGQPRSRGTGR